MDFYDNFYDEYCEPSADKEKLFELTEIFKDIQKHLYSDKPLNLDDLESDLAEMCHVLMIKQHTGNLTVQRTKQPMPAYLSDWTSFNENYLRNVAI
jgi:hypothetical protein